MNHSISIIAHQGQNAGSARVVQFLNRQIRSQEAFGVEQEFPSLFSEFPGGESLVIEVGGQIASHVGLVVREFQHPGFRFKVGLLGSVVTDSAYRGTGMASQLLREAADRCKKRGALICVLWSDNADFYAPLGFVRAGKEYDLKFSSKDLPQPEGEFVDFNPAKHVYPIWRLYQRHDLKVDRSLEEQKRLLEIPNAQVFVTEKNGNVTSYVVVNKGADFKDYIHEWGGEVSELHRNIIRVQGTLFPQTELTMIAPPGYDLGLLRQLAVQRWDGVLGLIKVLDKDGLMNAYAQYLRYLGWDATFSRVDKKLKVKDKVITVTSPSEVISLVLSGENSLELPVLPFFLWGFDSI